MNQYSLVNGSSDAENNGKNTQEKTDDSETYPANPGIEPVKSKTRTLEIYFSNQENSVSITEYGKAKLEVVEKSKIRNADEDMSQGDSTQLHTEKTETQQP